MKLRYFLFLLACLFTAVACFDDETTLDTRQISEISIDSTYLQLEYNIDFKHQLTIEPVTSQSATELPLSYEWWVNRKLYSDSSVFYFEGKELGTYDVHLQVSNSDGSAFYDFKVFVNSPYEEGITVLSEDRDGSTMLSFMRKYTDEELAAGATESFETHCLTRNNPGFEFARRPSDLCKRASQLFLACREQPVIYALNAKTLEVENIISAPEYPDFIPLRMHMADNTFTLSTPVLCENNQFYTLSPKEGVILPNTLLNSTYSIASHLWYSKDSYLANFWDLEENVPLVFDSFNILALEEKELFEGHTPVAMFNHTEGDCFTIITQHNGQYVKTTLGYYVNDLNTYPSYQPDIRGEQTVVSGNPGLSPDMPHVSNTLYREWIYARGNRLYRWYFSDQAFPSQAWATIDLPKAEITSLALSPDQKQLYVGVHQPDEEGLNGHIYILDSDTGQLLTDKPWMRVAYKPVKIIYKTK